MLPALVITDIDGVWTDGGMIYDNHGNEWKKFNTSDSAGILFLRQLDIPFAIMTGENSIAVKNRAKKLKVEHLFLGIKNKLETATRFCEQLGINLDQVAFIGDDINDLKLLQHVGISAAPANAPEYVKERVQFVTQKSGGQGAFREFVETILKKEGVFDRVIQHYL